MSATFPRKVTVPGIPKLSATIYRNEQTKNGAEYINYTLAYPLLGKLKRQTFADLDKAVAAGEEAIKRMANDEQRVLELSNSNRDEYVRAKDIMAPFNIALDVAAQEYADLRRILNGIGSPAEACRAFVQQHSSKLPKISVPDAVSKCLTQCRKDGKSKVRMHELEHYLNEFADSMAVDVDTLSSVSI